MNRRLPRTATASQEGERAAWERPGAGSLADRYAAVRGETLARVEGLSEADCQVQSAEFASPAKWHLAHTAWFFETFVLERFEPAFKAYEPAFRVLFNSYYQGVGPQHARPQRGLLTRPSLAAVKAWRAAVDVRMQALLDRSSLHDDAAFTTLVELGLQHEQQHQELLWTDLLHLFSCSPLAPAVLSTPPAASTFGDDGHIELDGGLVEIGHTGPGFAFDNETPRHRVFLAPYRLSKGLVTNADWQAFTDDGGYRQPRWWLSAGWDWLNTHHIEGPLHWRADGRHFTLHGLLPREPLAPVLHISLYEADAYAHWAAAQRRQPLRLPTEAEWEHAAATTTGLSQATGPAWQWTASAYAAYPGFRAWEGAVGEYNAKFMANQFVLRGGSLATPAGHARPSYRNFFPADARWQFSGLRLASDAV